MAYLGDMKSPAYWRAKQNLGMDMNMAASLEYINQLLKSIEELARKEITEKILLNNLSGIELRMNTFDEDFREDVFNDYKRIVESDDGTTSIHVLADKTRISLAHVDLSKCFEELPWTVDLMDGWIDTELNPGSIVEVNQAFGYMPKTTAPEEANLSDQDPSPYVLFLGWNEKQMTSKSLTHLCGEVGDEVQTKNFKAYTQHWLWNEKVFVQNLPKTCYAVVKPGAQENTIPNFWDPSQDYEDEDEDEEE